MGTPIFKICGEDVNVDQAIADALADSGLGISVNVPTELTALDDASMTNGAYVWVATQRVPYYLDKTSTATLAANSVVATGSSTGRWVRDLGFNSQTWIAQNGWFINPTTGSDTGSGTVASPIATIAEWYRRTGGQFINDTQMTLLSAALPGNAWPVSDPFEYTVLPLGVEKVFSVIGTNVTSRSGTITAATTGDPAANTANTITDGVISWASDVGSIILFANGTHSVIAKNIGAGVARISIVTNTTGTVQAVPTSGSYQIVTGTSIRFEGRALDGGTAIGSIAGAALYVQDLTITNSLRTWNYSDIFARCRLNALTSIDQKYSYGSRFFGCSIVGTFIASLPSRFTIAASCLFGEVSMAGSATLHYENNLAQGARMFCGRPTDASGAFDSYEISGAKITLSNAGVTANGAGCGFFDMASVVLEVSHAGMVNIGNRCFYGNVTAQLLLMRSVAQVIIDSSYTPTIVTTAGLPINLPNLPAPSPIGTQIPRLTPGAVVPAAASCTTFAAWDAAPFSRQVTTQTQGCGLYSNI
jgi:hypothetical protein